MPISYWPPDKKRLLKFRETGHLLIHNQGHALHDARQIIWLDVCRRFHFQANALFSPGHYIMTLNTGSRAAFR